MKLSKNVVEFSSSLDFCEMEQFDLVLWLFRTYGEELIVIHRVILRGNPRGGSTDARDSDFVDDSVEIRVGDIGSRGTDAEREI